MSKQFRITGVHQGGGSIIRQSVESRGASIKTGGLVAEKESESRARLSPKSVPYSPSNVIKPKQTVSSAYLKALEKGPKSGVLASLANTAQGAFSGHDDDAGTHAAATAISGAIVAHKGYGALVKTGEAIVSTGKGAADVVSSVKKGVETVGGASKIASSAGVSRVNDMRHARDRAKRGVSTVRTGVSSAAGVVRTGASVVGGVADGSLPAYFALGRAAEGGKKFAHGAANLAAGGAIKAGRYTVVKVVPGALKLSGRVAVGGAALMGDSENDYVQAVGRSASGAHVGVRTAVSAAKFSGRAVKTSVKGGVRTARTVRRGAAFIRHKGLAAAWRHGRRKARIAAARAGKSAASAFINLFKLAGKKLIMPAVLIIAIVAAVHGAVSLPVQAVAVIFGGVFSTEGGEHNVREFIMDPENGLPAIRASFVGGLVEWIQEQHIGNGGDYHIVRFYTNAGSEVVGNTYAEIDRAVISVGDLSDIIHPIFNVLLLMNYDLEPTGEQATALLHELFFELFSTSYVQSLERCGQDNATGVGEPRLCLSCGGVHAIRSCAGCISNERLCTHQAYLCPNPVLVFHDNLTCSMCCFITEFGTGCSGSFYCGGHKILSVTLTMDGVFSLLHTHFLAPIEYLLNLSNRTEEQERQLLDLQGYYEIVLEMVTLYALIYGGGMTLEDLGNVDWVDSTRAGRSAVVALAMAQAGQTGGQPFWRWYGFGARVPWCAIFIHWVYVHAGYGHAFPTRSQANTASSWGLWSFFLSQGQIRGAGYRDLAPGDVIFFDWQRGGWPTRFGQLDHVGIVIGRCEANVYIVDGNAGDRVRVRSFPLGSAVISGYALMS